MVNRDAGESEPETAYYGLGDMAGDAAALLAALGIDRAHVLAPSVGAIALHLALDHPAQVDRLVLVSPSVGGEPGHRASEPLPPPAESWIDDPVERLRLLLPDILGPDYRARMDEGDEAAIVDLERGNRTTWAGAMRQEAAAGDDRMSSRLAEVRTPTLVIHGDADVAVPLERGQALAAGVSGARFVALPGVGHWPWVERPDATIGGILAFLTEVVEPAPAGWITRLTGACYPGRHPRQASTGARRRAVNYAIALGRATGRGVL